MKNKMKVQQTKKKSGKIYYITGNNSKFLEAKEIMKDSEVVLEQKDLKIQEIKSLEQEKVLLGKAREAFKQLKKPLIIDDVGIYFEEYPKFPGTFTKFLFEAIGFEGIEKLLAGKNRNAYFRILLCYKDTKSEKVFEGILKGKIIENTQDLKIRTGSMIIFLFLKISRFLFQRYFWKKGLNSHTGKKHLINYWNG